MFSKNDNLDLQEQKLESNSIFLSVRHFYNNSKISCVLLLELSLHRL